MKNVTNDIIYVGVNDHKVDLFEGQYKVPNGMSYNSYVVLDEKVTVFDTVDANFNDEWLENVSKALNGRKPDSLELEDEINIDYSKIKPLWDKNLSMNGVSFGVPSATMSVIISEVYRCKEKPELKYAKVVGKNFTKVQLDYITSNIREICARNSTFAALTFEDFDAMLTASLNIKNYNRRESISPVEKIIKM